MTCDLLELPVEVLHEVMMHLPVQSLCALAQVCHFLHAVVVAESLWARLYFRDAPAGAISPQNDSRAWSLRYKERSMLHCFALLTYHRQDCAVSPPRCVIPRSPLPMTVWRHFEKPNPTATCPPTTRVCCHSVASSSPVYTPSECCFKWSHPMPAYSLR